MEEVSLDLEQKTVLFNLGRVTVHGVNIVASVIMPAIMGYSQGKASLPPEPLWGLSSAMGTLAGVYESADPQNSQLRRGVKWLTFGAVSTGVNLAVYHWAYHCGQLSRSGFEYFP